MKVTFITLLLLVGCSTKNHNLLTKQIEKLTPSEVAKTGTEEDIFEKAKLLIDSEDHIGFVNLIKDVKNINARDAIGDTLLHIAVGSKTANSVKEVIKRGANVDAINNFQKSPLHYAIWAGTRESARALLQAGADPEIPDYWGHNCLMMAAYHDDIGMVQLFIKFKVSPFSKTPGAKSASQLGHWPEVKKALLDYEKSYSKK